MASPLIEPSPSGLLGPDPGRSIRIWVTLLLRLGIGLSLLSTGLSGYFGMHTGGGMGAGLWGPRTPLSMLDPFMSGMPYLAIGLGLALILGFLTTASAIGAGLYSLIIPVFAIVQTVMTGSNGGFNMGGGWGNQEYIAMMMTMSLPNILTNAAMIWLSPLENNPISVDALIFGRNEIEPESFPTPVPIPTPEPSAVEEAPIQIGE
jgi:uncharacterized membrane protein YphA (DoxX/SURF4 family)